VADVAPTLLSAAGLRLPDHPVADVFPMPPAKLAAALFHDPLLASRPGEFAALVASFLASHPLAPRAESGASQ
jgi:hypothetical protein